MRGIGIDFGTSNSVAAWFDGSEIHIVEIEPSAATVPTAAHFNRHFQTLTGTFAVGRYVEENTGRRVELVAKSIGVAATSVEQSQGGEDRAIIYGPIEDHGLPGRLFLGLKRLLGDDRIDRISVFEKQFRLVALITPILTSIKQAVDFLLVEPHKPICFGRPVEFEGRGNNRNEMAMKGLQESCHYSGLNDIQFYREPVAASLSFIHSNKIVKDCTILTVDFGGGTLDLSLIHRSKTGFEVLGTEGLTLGGDLIDQQIYKALVFPALGKGVQWSRKVDGRQVDTPFPFAEYEHALLNWSITHTLNQNKYLATVSKYIGDNGAEKEKIARLRDVILHNESYRIFQAIKKAKAELSTLEETVLEIPEINLSIPLSREFLADTISEMIQDLNNSLSHLLEKSGLAANDVDYVVRTGGSSKLVAVVSLLEGLFPGKVVAHNSFTSVASGLAIASYYGFSSEEERREI